jgi:pimeloyl-ACP methyl ester carboxylesterase
MVHRSLVAVDPRRHRQVGVGSGQLHVVEAGPPDGRPPVFLHGWPESWRTWGAVMTLPANQARAIALDLPGIGGSITPATGGSKRQLSAVVHELPPRD